MLRSRWRGTDGRSESVDSRYIGVDPTLSEMHGRGLANDDERYQTVYAVMQLQEAQETE